MTCCPFRSERCQQVGVFLAISVVFGINSIVLLAFLYAMNKRESAFMISLALTFFIWGGSSYALFPATNSGLFYTVYSARD